jgi:hypothetical protein
MTPPLDLQVERLSRLVVATALGTVLGYERSRVSIHGFEGGSDSEPRGGTLFLDEIGEMAPTI